MLPKHLYKTIKSQSGFGIIEAVIALGLLLILGWGTVRWLSSTKSQMMNLSGLAQCQAIANDLMSQVKSLDNALQVRTYLPHNPMSIATNLEDKLCRPNISTIGCDTLPLANVQADHHIIAEHYPNGEPYWDVFLSQNIRGATTFLLSLYNQTNPQICDKGLIFSLQPQPGEYPLTDLYKYLPVSEPISLPDSVQKVRLNVTELERTLLDRGCSDIDSTARPQNERGFRFEIKVTTSENANNKNCEAQQNFFYEIKKYEPDADGKIFAPALILKNGRDEVVWQYGMPTNKNYCTCNDPNGGSDCVNTLRLYWQGGKSNSADNDFAEPDPTATVPPSLIPFCQAFGSGFADHNMTDYGGYNAYYCFDSATKVVVKNLEGNSIEINSNTPYANWDSLNGGLSGLMVEWNIVPPNPNDLHTLTAGMISHDGRIYEHYSRTPAFHFSKPQCDPNRPCGIEFSDGCGGTCPAIACPAPCGGCADPTAFCPEDPKPIAQDSCGNSCPAGIKNSGCLTPPPPVVDCKPAAQASNPPDPFYDSDGNLCPPPPAPSCSSLGLIECTQCPAKFESCTGDMNECRSVEIVTPISNPQRPDCCTCNVQSVRCMCYN